MRLLNGQSFTLQAVTDNAASIQWQTSTDGSNFEDISGETGESPLLIRILRLHQRIRQYITERLLPARLATRLSPMRLKFCFFLRMSFRFGRRAIQWKVMGHKILSWRQFQMLLLRKQKPLIQKQWTRWKILCRMSLQMSSNDQQWL